MTKLHILSFLVSIAVLCCIPSCRESKDGVTPAPPNSVHNVQENDAFSMLINGEKWVPRWDNRPDPPYFIQFDELTGRLYFQAYLKIPDSPVGPIDQVIGIESQTYGIGLYFINTDISYLEDRINCGIYKPDTTINDAFLKIGRLNLFQDEIAGAFDLIMVNPDCPDTLVISQGFFSGPYKDF